MTLDETQKLGLMVVKTVQDAEAKFPNPGSGALKRAYVERRVQQAMDLPMGLPDNPCVVFWRWVGLTFARFAIEIAVAALNAGKAQLPSP